MINSKASDRGCVEDQPQKATKTSTPGRNLELPDVQTFLRLVFDTAAIQFH
jgi:hypothetical protein